MIKRILGQKIGEAAEKMPVVAVTGPRQSGKSTLVKQVFSSYAYANLEDLVQRQYARDDPKGFLFDLGERAVIDEIQHAPDLLSYIQVAVDESGRAGQYIISGSQNLLLMESVSQSLAGRVAIFNLFPFSLEEIHHTQYRLTRYEDYIVKGFYPRIYDKGLDPYSWLLDYIQTYVERDLRQLIAVPDLGAFRQFLEICAGRIGQLVNFSSMGNDIGVSYQTIKRWLSLLQTSFLVHTLRPFHRNFNKRITKSSKLYFYDTGLACALLNIRTPDELSRYYAKGALFENFVINEIIKNHVNRHLRPGFYFWKDSSREIDLLLDQGGQLYPVALKSGRTINPDFFDGLKYFQALSGALPENCFLVYGGDEKQTRSVGKVVGWEELGNWVVG